MKTEASFLWNFKVLFPVPWKGRKTSEMELVRTGTYQSQRNEICTVSLPIKNSRHV